ncbi:hypothetical protein [Streptomyces bluensis]|uniref:Uncharacterized protein n=1 Tax=Streptomyces bluensis TaxID=33897 RepID=A0ABW6UED7_9ACTN
MGSGTCWPPTTWPNTRYVAQLGASRAQRVVLTRDGRTEHLFLNAATGAWAVLWERHGQWMVRQNGQSCIWDAIEEHVTRWRAAGAPPLERFEIAVSSDRSSITWPGDGPSATPVHSRLF